MWHILNIAQDTYGFQLEHSRDHSGATAFVQRREDGIVLTADIHMHALATTEQYTRLLEALTYLADVIEQKEGQQVHSICYSCKGVLAQEANVEVPFIRDERGYRLVDLKFTAQR